MSIEAPDVRRRRVSEMHVALYPTRRLTILPVSARLNPAVSIFCGKRKPLSTNHPQNRPSRSFRGTQCLLCGAGGGVAITEAIALLGDRPIPTNQVEIHVFVQTRPIVDHCRSIGILIDRRQGAECCPCRTE